MYELLGLLWKHLFCRNLCVLFAGCGRAVVLVVPHTPFCSHCAPRVGGGVPFSWRGVEHFFLAAVLGLFVAVLVCNWWYLFCLCISLLLSLLAPFLPKASLYLSPLLTIAILLPCLPLCCVYLVSFSFILQKLPHSFSKLIGQSSPLLPLCYLVGLTPELYCSGSCPTVFISFLSFSTVLDHSSSCWTSSVSYSFASPEKHHLCFFLFTPLYLVLSAVHPDPPNQFSTLNFLLASPSPQCIDYCHN